MKRAFAKLTLKISVMTIGVCMFCLSCMQSGAKKTARDVDTSRPLNSGGQRNQLMVLETEVMPILIGKHQSLRLNFELSKHADYAFFEIYRDGENDLLKSGRVYLGPVLVHDLPEGLMHIKIWACKEMLSIGDGLDKENCGKSSLIRYNQPLNTDTELIAFLKQREHLIDQQKDLGEQLIEAVSEYRKAKSQNAGGSEKELEEFIEPIEEAGAGKVGDLIAKAPGLEQNSQEDQSDSRVQEEEEEEETGGTAGHLSFSNGVALLYLVGAGIKKFGGDSQSPKKLKAEYKNRMVALSQEISGAAMAKGDSDRLRAELNKLGADLGSLIESDPRSPRLEDLRNQERVLHTKLDQAEHRYTDHINRQQQLLAEDLSAAPSKINIWVKRAGAMTALIGAGLILFTSFDEGLLGKLDKFLDKMVFALTAQESSPEFKLRRSLDVIARQSQNLKLQVFQVEQQIDQHLKNASKN